MGDQIRRWGWQTHHIQLRAAIVLQQITRNGMHLDQGRREELIVTLTKVKQAQLKTLRGFGYIPGETGSQKTLQAILTRIERKQEIVFHRTETGKISTSADHIQEYAEEVPFLQCLQEYKATEKLLGSFLSKMNKPVIRPSFNVLARTGRTTSFGQLNAQNLPRDDRIRSCFVPRPGTVLLALDYKTIELVTLAQACLSQFGLGSRMGEAINNGQDLHRLVAAKFAGKPESEISKSERSKAKPVNFGKPGGMGDASLRRYAKASYGVDLTEDEVKQLSDAWFAEFPEMRSFLEQDSDPGLEVANLLGLTLEDHAQHTENLRFLNHLDNRGQSRLPNAILGWMCLKTLASPVPSKRDGTHYSSDDVDYFWTAVDKKKHILRTKWHTKITNREPSWQLKREVMNLAGRRGVFTLTGRLRANANYCARHNTIFQGLAADGCKLALWGIWRAGYRLVNFIHDEVLVEVPTSDNLKECAEELKALMVEGMEEVIPDIRVDVNYAAMARWFKDAEAVFGEAGELLLWTPEGPARA